MRLGSAGSSSETGSEFGESQKSGNNPGDTAQPREYYRIFAKAAFFEALTKIALLYMNSGGNALQRRRSKELFLDSCQHTLCLK